MKQAFSSKIEPDLIKALKKLSKDTRIPQARLIEEAFEDLLKKHEKNK